MAPHQEMSPPQAGVKVTRTPELIGSPSRAAESFSGRESETLAAILISRPSTTLWHISTITQVVEHLTGEKNQRESGKVLCAL